MYVSLSLSPRLAVPQLPAPDRSGPYRTSTTSPRSQWALPDLHRKRQMVVGTVGPQVQAPDIGVGSTGPASARSQQALPDRVQQQAPDRSGHYRTSTASSRSQGACITGMSLGMSFGLVHSEVVSDPSLEDLLEENLGSRGFLGKEEKSPWVDDNSGCSLDDFL